MGIEYLAEGAARLDRVDAGLHGADSGLMHVALALGCLAASTLVAVGAAFWSRANYGALLRATRSVDLSKHPACLNANGGEFHPLAKGVDAFAAWDPAPVIAMKEVPGAIEVIRGGDVISYLGFNIAMRPWVEKNGATIEKFRDEEVHHRDTGLAHGAEQAPAYPALTRAIKTGSKLAIWLAERL